MYKKYLTIESPAMYSKTMNMSAVFQVLFEYRLVYETHLNSQKGRINLRDMQTL
jgi:hypothetical protein